MPWVAGRLPIRRHRDGRPYRVRPPVASTRVLTTIQASRDAWYAREPVSCPADPCNLWSFLSAMMRNCSQPVSVPSFRCTSDQAYGVAALSRMFRESDDCPAWRNGLMTTVSRPGPAVATSSVQGAAVMWQGRTVKTWTPLSQSGRRSPTSYKTTAVSVLHPRTQATVSPVLDNLESVGARASRDDRCISPIDDGVDAVRQL